ncbi:uncharacterized protein LOC108042943 isoform X2 [Drosophila rhopaloa]|uniref:Uncharacterized protein LOC108042943 isoform X2 n=1 Tax=Drosophila rhopaloa TaxID=1041015 RepID=A0A6P4EV19_DRORH|nr:uncharacterized protein LOC108042943 isoform X2 [Drosophila rhopaloa]
MPLHYGAPGHRVQRQVEGDDAVQEGLPAGHPHRLRFPDGQRNTLLLRLDRGHHHHAGGGHRLLRMLCGHWSQLVPVEDARDPGGSASAGGQVRAEDDPPVRRGLLPAVPLVRVHQPAHPLRHRPVDRPDVRPAGEPHPAEPDHHQAPRGRVHHEADIGDQGGDGIRGPPAAGITGGQPGGGPAGRPGHALLAQPGHGNGRSGRSGGRRRGGHPQQLHAGHGRGLCDICEPQWGGDHGDHTRGGRDGVHDAVEQCHHRQLRHVRLPDVAQVVVQWPAVSSNAPASGGHGNGQLLAPPPRLCQSDSSSSSFSPDLVAPHPTDVAGGHLASVVESVGQDRHAAAAGAAGAAAVRHHAAPLRRHLQLCDVPHRAPGSGRQPPCAEERRDPVPLLPAGLPLDVLLPDDAALRDEPLQAQDPVAHAGQHLQVPGPDLHQLLHVQAAAQRVRCTAGIRPGGDRLPAGAGLPAGHDAGQLDGHPAPGALHQRPAGAPVGRPRPLCGGAVLLPGQRGTRRCALWSDHAALELPLLLLPEQGLRKGRICRMCTICRICWI